MLWQYYLSDDCVVFLTKILINTGSTYTGWYISHFNYHNKFFSICANNNFIQFSFIHKKRCVSASEAQFLKSTYAICQVFCTKNKLFILNTKSCLSYIRSSKFIPKFMRNYCTKLNDYSDSVPELLEDFPTSLVSSSRVRWRNQTPREFQMKLEIIY